MPKIKVKAVPSEPEFDMEFHKDTNWDTEWEEPQAINVEEREEIKPRIERTFHSEAMNEEFDNTYKQEKTPLWKKWPFWVILVFLILGALILAQHFSEDRGSSNLQNVSATTTAASEQTTTADGVTVTNFVLPAGATVTNGYEGWGVYDANEELVEDYTGIGANNYGTWYIADGLVQFDYTGNLTVNGTTYPVEEGKVNVGAPAAEATTASVTVASNDVANATDSQKKALEAAQAILADRASSYNWMAAQLEADGYSKEDARWATEHCGADWNEQAYLKAQEYLKMTSFTRADLIAQLEFEEFTSEQAAYAADKLGL